MRYSLLFVLIPVLFVSCTSSSEPSAWSLSGEMSEKKVVQYSEVIEKASSKIKDTPEFNDCMRPSVNMCLNQVGSQIARTQKSEAFCNEIVDIESREGCRFWVVMVKAMESRDIRLCDVLTGANKIQCRSGIIIAEATVKKDTKLCDTLGEGETNGTVPTIQLEQCKMSVLQSKSSITEEDCKIFTEKSMKDMCSVMVKSRIQSALPLQPLEKPAVAPVSKKKK